MHTLLGLKCVSCGREFTPDEIDYTCPACGPLTGTREVLYDYRAISKLLTRKTLAQNREFSHWRYLPLLPVLQPEKIQPLSVGWTPLYRSPQLENQWGLERVWIKDDSRNPTASLKDRASSVAVVKALEKGVGTVTAASTGNAASSWSAFTALAGLKTAIFVPQNAPRPKIAQLLLFGATVLKVNGNYDDAFDLCCRAAEKWGWYNRSTAINPYLGEGKKTAALEICEQLNWEAPDYVFVSVGDGCIFQGMWKGFKEFYQLGLIERLPKMIGVQAQGSAPLVRAWESRAERCEPLQPRTIADSISVGVPRDQVKALKAARESGGRFTAVSDEEILSAISLLARSAGVFAEPAGAAALAGLKKLAAQGACGRQDRVVVVVTGHGLKDIDGVMQAVSRQPLQVENDLEDVAEKIPSFFHC
ncbi:MAG: threonine synthase [Calditrichaceae bacterium]|nr:threonine synthase [Calditrichia bacterium]NUQ44118.1 threonine synthase [Calditrichaceae bacterium]